MICLLSVYLFRPVQDPDFAEVLTDLNSRELFWLSRGQLEIAVETEGQDARKISGFITGRKSCDSKCPSTLPSSSRTPLHRRNKAAFSLHPSSRYYETPQRHQTRELLAVSVSSGSGSSMCGSFRHLPSINTSCLSASFQLLSLGGSRVYRPFVELGGTETRPV